MDQRTLRQLKALQNKLANVTADITILEKEINLSELLSEKESLTLEQSEYTNMVREEHEMRAKIDSCNLKIKEYEGAKLDAEHVKKKSLNDEQEIYNNEHARISFAFGEWQDYMREKLAELCATRDDIQRVLDDLGAEKAEVDTVLNTYSAVKRDLRLQNMNMILAQQMAYKQDKERYKSHTDTVAGLLLEKAQFASKVNTYTQDRYNINNDYYAWKCECDELAKQQYHTSAEHDGEHEDGHKLFEARAKLARDPRQDYAMRYMKLDADLVHSQNMIKRIDRQLAKLEAVKKERPILRLNKNGDEHAILAEYNMAKKSCDCLQNQVDQQRCMIESVQCEINKVQSSINTGQRPAEICEFDNRAKQRLEIMTKRITDKYACTVSGLEAKINEYRQLLTAYQTKYDVILANKSKKEVYMVGVTNTLNTLNDKLVRKAVLDRLMRDKEQILESIAQITC